MYADDTQVYISFRPLSEMTITVSTISKCIDEIKVWMNCNYLKINVNKTQVLCVGNKASNILFQDRLVDMIETKVGIEHTQIVPSTKLLGVQLDDELSVLNRVNQIYQSVTFHLKTLNALRNHIPSETKIILVKALILSKIDYCNILLSLCPNYLKKKLQKALNRAVRFIYCLKQRDSVTPYLKRAHFLPVEYRIRYKQSIEVFKIFNNQSPSYLQDFLHLYLPLKQGLRSSNDFELVETNHSSKTLAYVMCKQWNSLPFTLRSITSLQKFKKALKTYYFDIAFN